MSILSCFSQLLLVISESHWALQRRSEGKKWRRILARSCKIRPWDPAKLSSFKINQQHTESRFKRLCIDLNQDLKIVYRIHTNRENASTSLPVICKTQTETFWCISKSGVQLQSGASHSKPNQKQDFASLCMYNIWCVKAAGRGQMSQVQLEYEMSLEGNWMGFLWVCSGRASWSNSILSCDCH